ncbi:MAG: HlyD family secretion protein [Bryobacteraceae bacterium]|nr:HlyD family secretion protein [Bryobacteraceae bacterium]
MNDTLDLVGASEPLPALKLVGSTRFARWLATWLFVLILLFVAALGFAPWVQTVVGSGRVIALNPVDRSQTIDAPVEGRIRRWAVVEGTKVKTGDLVAEIMDNDPEVLLRRNEELTAVNQRLEQAKLRVTSLESSLRQLDLTRRNELLANSSRIDMAKATGTAAEQQIRAGEADLLAAQQNLERRKLSVERGLSSIRDLEVGQQAYQTAAANLDRFRANLTANRNDVLARQADQDRIETAYQRQINDAQAALAAARGDVQNFTAEMKRMQITVARQSTQTVTAPRDGTIFRLLAQPGSELLKSGDPVAILIPDSAVLTVELHLDGRDTPLVHKGDKVRLEFEGWPSVQFTGWPSVAIGTFGGRVFLVDQTDDGKGKFRILVEPDPKDMAWPNKTYLRQGVRANGWVLLREVRLGWELWRQFNGFPPTIADKEPGSDKGGKK